MTDSRHGPLKGRCSSRLPQPRSGPQGASLLLGCLPGLSRVRRPPSILEGRPPPLSLALGPLPSSPIREGPVFDSLLLAPYPGACGAMTNRAPSSYFSLFHREPRDRARLALHVNDLLMVSVLCREPRDRAPAFVFSCFPWFSLCHKIRKTKRLIFSLFF